MCHHRYRDSRHDRAIWRNRLRYDSLVGQEASIEKGHRYPDGDPSVGGISPIVQ